MKLDLCSGSSLCRVARLLLGGGCRGRAHKEVGVVEGQQRLRGLRGQQDASHRQQQAPEREARQRRGHAQPDIL